MLRGCCLFSFYNSNCSEVGGPIKLVSQRSLTKSVLLPLHSLGIRPLKNGMRPRRLLGVLTQEQPGKCSLLFCAFIYQELTTFKSGPSDHHCSRNFSGCAQAPDSDFSVLGGFIHYMGRPFNRVSMLRRDHKCVKSLDTAPGPRKPTLNISFHPWFWSLRDRLVRSMFCLGIQTTALGVPAPEENQAEALQCNAILR